MHKNHFVLLKKFKNTESAQLCSLEHILSVVTFTWKDPTSPLTRAADLFDPWRKKTWRRQVLFAYTNIVSPDSLPRDFSDRLTERASCTNQDHHETHACYRQINQNHPQSLVHEQHLLHAENMWGPLELRQKVNEFHSFQATHLVEVTWVKNINQAGRWAGPRAGHFRYFGVFSINKWFFYLFNQVNYLFLHRSYFKSPLPV